MRDGGRLGAAIQVLEDIETRHRPARLALKSWGESARYAGSKDRAFVSGLVLDALRKRRSMAARMGESTARALGLATLRFNWDWPVDRIAEAAADPDHGPGLLTDAERQRLSSEHLPHMAPDVAGDYPNWLEPHLTRAFGDQRSAEAAALSERAPVDLRCNSLKTDPVRAAKVLAPLGVEPAGILPDAFRIAAPRATERTGSVETIPAFGKGWFEVQDLGSQIAASCASDIRGKQVLDYCAGGGGKTLALAALMGNSGQLYAHDIDPRRMGDLVPRAVRAGVRNLQVRSAMTPEGLDELKGRMDLVFVDAPCTGSGTWRRHPDAKWRLTPEQLSLRQADQDLVLAQAAHFVRPGGRMIYVTCSILMEENEDRIGAFLGAHTDFSLSRPTLPSLSAFITATGYLRLTPKSAGTDGFFAALMERKA